VPDSRAQEYRLVCELTAVPGWEYVRRYVVEKIAKALQRLENEDASNVVQMARLQGQVRALRDFLAHINFCIEEAGRLGDRA